MNPIQTGLLAYGMSGRIFHAPFLEAHPGFALRAVAERSRKQMQTTYPHVISYDSVADLLRDPAIELVVVNTPNDSHFSLATEALHAGKHVLIEKPVGTSAADIDALYALGRQMNRQVFGYQNRRWDSDFMAVRQVVESGQLGQLLEVHIRFDRYKTAIHTKVFKEEPSTPGSGLHFDLGPHILDQTISLFGRPSEFRRTLGSFRPNSRVTDYMQLHLLYPNGLNVYLTTSLLVADPGPAFVLHGTYGSLRKGRTDVQEAQLDHGLTPLDDSYGLEPADAAGTLTLVNENGEKAVQSIEPLRGNYMGLFEAVHQAIRNGQPYPIREDELRTQLEILES
ncbi:Gfo/Idh/MocA family oxidoreductase [Hymenobacter tibetensis]|uniref:Gfo/Idh/MocA family oxidoreductase n=1 Tax=Hymenobacter tibetensis TaxID=497967 RepID=A0ABY4CU81_9BACT|nr:Gfo/Idh/MocA family oxidoreductase [Hymenobacter tibetensis]UOG73666.1 Gfo/Idh/MocA family oxidoreductase [Hymenobacter tibetensis]